MRAATAIEMDRVWRDFGSLQQQYPNKHNKVKRDEKINRRREYLEKLFIKFGEDFHAISLIEEMRVAPMNRLDLIFCWLVP